MEKEANIIKLLANPNNLQNFIVIENKNYHIYVINSEEIKEGDWYMYCHFGEWIISNSRETLKNKTNTLENLNKDDYFKKIIATTDRSLKIERNFTDQQGYFEYLPRPSDDFLRAFVEKQSKITKLLVEYIDWCDYDDDNEVGLDKPDLRLKVAPDNTITIKPIQEEKASWSRDEVITYGKLAFEVGRNYQLTGENNLSEIEENL